MGRRCPGMTADEHFEMGAALFALRNEILDRFVRIANDHYPKAAAQTVALRNALKHLDRTRMLLDSAFANEHPTEFDPSAYYPGADAEREVNLTIHDSRTGGQGNEPTTAR